MNNKYKVLAKDTIIFALGSLGSKVILFFLVPIYTNYLSTEEYGTADLVTTFVTLISPITALSIEKAVIRFGMKNDEKKENVILTAFIILLFSVVVTLILTPLISIYKPIASWKLYLVILVVLTNITEVERSYLKVKNMNKAYSLIGILQTAVLAGTNILFLALLHKGIEGYLTANIIALVVCALVSMIVSNIHRDIRKGKYNRILLKRMVSFSAPLIISGIAWWIMHSSDKVMIEWMVGVSALGIYTAATKIPSLINVITVIFNQAWTIASIRENETSKDDSFYAKTFDYYCTLLFGAGVVIISVVKPIMNIYVGVEFGASWVYTPFLLVSAIFYAVSGFCGTLYAAIQKSINDMWTTLSATLMNIVVNYIFIIKYDIWGAIIGTVSSVLMYSIVRIIDIKRYINFNIDICRLIINAAIVIGLAASVTWEFYPTVISLASILIYIVVNIKYIGMVIKSAVKIIKR